MATTTRNRPMWDGMLNLRTSEIRLRDQLKGRERDWLIGQLLAKRGVRDAEYRDDDAREIVVQYDADQLSGAELVNFLYICGLPVKVSATV